MKCFTLALGSRFFGLCLLPCLAPKDVNSDSSPVLLSFQSKCEELYVQTFTCSVLLGNEGVHLLAVVRDFAACLRLSEAVGNALPGIGSTHKIESSPNTAEENKTNHFAVFVLCKSFRFGITPPWASSFLDLHF